ncbi:Cell division control protein 2 -like protein [Caligus rogercresseyi]|uniref:Cell division control protein 2 -like protein n=1 Tax=Caligus rogercresseyi TaxID=217165 RepID=A0A7T8H271_CALRO|nr:Cell division control protein 2 -like protein [Caligus rogercresseyi]
MWKDTFQSLLLDFRISNGHDSDPTKPLNTAKMDMDLVKSYVYQILQGILFCHCRRVVHRDLKPQIFSLTRKVPSRSRTLALPVVTLWYRAPEILLGSNKYSCPIDIWSIGCIFAELCNKKPLFQGDSEIDQLFRIFRVLRTPTDDIWPGVTQLPDFKATFPSWGENNLESQMKNLDKDGLDLLQSMLHYDPAKRISARRALKHPYFDNLDKYALPAKPGEYDINIR